MVHRLTAMLIFMALLLATTFAGAGRAVRAATLSVTSTADDGSAGTLRSTIAAASAGDTIIFDSTVFASKKTIVLTQGSLTIGQSLTISGPAAGVAIDGSPQYTVLHVTGGTAQIPVALSGLTLQDGQASVTDTAPGESGYIGGGLCNDGTVTLTGCTWPAPKWRAIR